MDRATVLVVEDNATTRKMMRAALDGEDLRVVEAADAAAALAAVAGETPDLILQDLVLPDLDGFELVARLRALPHLAATPILALTGLLSRADEARVAAAGFTDLLIKPVEPSLLRRVVASYLAVEPAAGRPPAPAEPKRILLVDDDPVQLKLAGLRLAMVGHLVTTAADGAEALELARRERFDAVVSDVLMPRLDGYGLCLALRGDPALAALPVVLVSSNYVDARDHELGRKAGASAFVERTPTLEAVIEALARHLGAGAPPAPAPEPGTVAAAHGERLARQLERQLQINSSLTRRCLTQATELALLGASSDALTRHVDVYAAMDDVLAACLDAGGISQGTLYLVEPGGRMVARGYGVNGIGAARGEDLTGFYGHRPLLDRIIAGGVPVAIPSAEVPEDVAASLLQRGGFRSALVVPILAQGGPIGALLFASRSEELHAHDLPAFARTVAAQIGHAVALARAFARVQASEARYRALMDGASDGIVVLTEDGRILERNAAFRRLTGREADDLVGRHVSEFVPPEERQRTLADFARLRAGGSVRARDVRVVTADGGEVIVDFSASLVDTGGERLVLAMARDMTERRRMEDALRASEARFRSLVESIEDIVFTTDREQRLTGIFGRWVERAGRLPEHHLGKTVLEVLGPEAGKAHAEASARALAGERAVYEWSQPGPGGGSHFQTSVSPIRDADGRVTGVVGLTRDVTELKQAQTQLLLSDRMVSIGTLAAGVAHEINNPLAAILTNLDFVLRIQRQAAAHGEPCPLWGEVEEPLLDAREGADRVRVIVRDLRVFSRSGDEERRGPVDVERVLESALRMASNEIRHRAQLVRAYDPALPAVLASEARLGQVFLNLVVNAAQAIPEGRADHNAIRVTTRGGGGKVVVEVADTGAGIPPEVVGRIFDPFFTTKPAGVGTGLGLPISQRIVAGLGGTLELESQPGKGTTVRVTLPAAAEAGSAPAPVPAAGPAPRRGRILVVDDEAAIGAAIRRSLEGEHDVVAVTGAHAALERVRAGERFDVILCDLMMPVMTGMDLHQALLLEAPDQAERIIFLTGGAFTERARAFLDVVANPRLDKPFEIQTLRALIHRRL